jgi:outer membrane protein, heavy metal efflux system
MRTTIPKSRRQPIAASSSTGTLACPEGHRRACANAARPSPSTTRTFVAAQHAAPHLGNFPAFGNPPVVGACCSASLLLGCCTLSFLERVRIFPSRVVSRTTVVFACAMAFSFATSSRAQEIQMPPSHEHAQHHHGDIKPVEAHYPQMGRAQTSAQGQLVTLEQVQKIAREMNPTLRQAEAEIRAANAHRQQAGLYPNPTVGYTGDEIRGGSVGGGKQGFFLEQTIVTGGKLRLSREVFGKEAQLATIEAEEQRIRVESAVKMAFLRVLAAQELLDARRDLSSIAQDAADTERRLMNTGQADETEVLTAEVEAKRSRLAARMQENTLREEWRSMSAVIGQPEMPMATVTGDLEKDWPALNEEEAVEAIVKESPAVRIADTATTHAQVLIARARREPIPDLQVRAGMEYNNELLDRLPFAKGWEGIAQVGVQIPIFNRNQGDIAAAHAEMDRAEQERRRIALTLRDRAASTVDQYANARLMAVEFRDSILPRAKKAYGLMVDKYGLALASYPRVLESQRKLFELQVEYIAALEGVWTTGIALQGYLLTDGLEAPARPGEVDRPVRETNVPMPERTMSPGEPMPRP